MTTASPCINVCTMDAASGVCRGCLRTLDEIAGWSTMPEAAKQGVLAALPSRRIAWAARRAGVSLAAPGGFAPVARAPGAAGPAAPASGTAAPPQGEPRR